MCDLGIEHPDYFQGFGVSFTRFDDAVVGVGSTPAEAYADALEQIASETDSSAVPEVCSIKYADESDIKPESEMLHHVGIRFITA